MTIEDIQQRLISFGYLQEEALQVLVEDFQSKKHKKKEKPPLEIILAAEDIYIINKIIDYIDRWKNE